MKKTRYSDEQIVRILRETDKDTVAEVAKRHGVSEATIYAWRKNFGSMETDEVKRLKALEDEICDFPWCIATPGLCADGGFPFRFVLHAEDAREGCSRSRGDGKRPVNACPWSGSATAWRPESSLRTGVATTM